MTDEYGVYLCELTLNPQGLLPVRQLAAVLLKQYIDAHWSQVFIRLLQGGGCLVRLSQLFPVLRIRIRKILASWIRIRKKMRIHGAKYQPKTATTKINSPN